jgi:hypothetical protein
MTHTPHPTRASLRRWEDLTGVSARYLAREYHAGRLPGEQIGRAIVAEGRDVFGIVRDLLRRVLIEEPR